MTEEEFTEFENQNNKNELKCGNTKIHTLKNQQQK